MHAGRGVHLISVRDIASRVRRHGASDDGMSEVGYIKVQAIEWWSRAIDG